LNDTGGLQPWYMDSNPLLSGIAALTGQIIGASLSPEIWIAVVIVAYTTKSFRGLLLRSIVASVILSALQIAVAAAFTRQRGEAFQLNADDVLRHAARDLVVLLLWSGIGWGLRRALRRRSRPA